MELTLRLPLTSRVFFTWKIFAVVCLLAVTATTVAPSQFQDMPLGCYLREYTEFVATKKGCRPQKIEVDACYGFCDTYQVPALLPPYKKSQHTMCSYGNFDTLTINLADCDAGVDRTFTYITARSCVCRSCTPENTFCIGIF